VARRSHPVGDLSPGCPHPAFGISIAEGLRGGIFTTSMPELASTPSNASVNCPARSRIRNRKPAARSPRSIRRLRICCTVQGPSGLGGDP